MEIRVKKLIIINFFEFIEVAYSNRGRNLSEISPTAGDIARQSGWKPAPWGENCVSGAGFQPVTRAYKVRGQADTLALGYYK